MADESGAVADERVANQDSGNVSGTSQRMALVDLDEAAGVVAGSPGRNQSAEDVQPSPDADTGGAAGSNQGEVVSSGAGEGVGAGAGAGASVGDTEEFKVQVETPLLPQGADTTPTDPAPFILPEGTTGMVVDRSNLSAHRRRLLTELFHLMDVDNSQYLQLSEVGALTGRFSQSKGESAALLETLDANKDGVASLDEFLNFFAHQSGNLTDAEFDPVWNVLMKVATRGQRPITWPSWAFYVFGATALVQILVRVVLLALTIVQWDDWDLLDSDAGLPEMTSPLRLIACVVGILLSFVGVWFFVSPPHKKARRLTLYGYAAAAVMILFFVSGVLDGVSFGIVKGDCGTKCDTDCSAVPTADYSACLAVPCECGYSILPGPAAEVQEVAVVTTLGLATGSMNLTVFAGSGNKGYTSPRIPLSSTAEQAQAILGGTVVSPAGSPVVNLTELLGPVDVSDVPTHQGWRFTFVEQLQDMEQLVVVPDNVLGAGVDIQVSTLVHGRASSSVTAVSTNLDDGPLLLTALLNFVAMVTSGVAAIIAIVFTSEWGRNLYLGDLHELMGVHETKHKRWWLLMNQSARHKNNDNDSHMHE